LNAESIANNFLNIYKKYPFETHQLFLKSYLQPLVDPLGLSVEEAGVTYSQNPEYKKYEIKEEYFDKMFFLNALIQPKVSFFKLQGKRLDIKVKAKGGLSGIAQEIEVEGDSASTVFNYIEADSGSFISDVEIFKIKSNSSLKHFRVIGGGNVASNVYYFLEEGAHVEIVELASGVDYYRLKSNIMENGIGANAEAYYGYDTGSASRIDVTSHIVINARNAQGNAYQRAVVRGSSRIYQKALVFNAQEGIGGRSYIEQKALLLSKDSYANNIPGMQLDSNDIMAKHSAATFSLSEDQLFYLMSRGLDMSASIKMLAEGILRPIKDKLHSEPAND